MKSMDRFHTHLTVFYAGSNHDITKFGATYGIEWTTQEFFVEVRYLSQNSEGISRGRKN